MEQCIYKGISFPLPELWKVSEQASEHDLLWTTTSICNKKAPASHVVNLRTCAPKTGPFWKLWYNSPRESKILAFLLALLFAHAISSLALGFINTDACRGRMAGRQQEPENFSKGWDCCAEVGASDTSCLILRVMRNLSFSFEIHLETI